MVVLSTGMEQRLLSVTCGHPGTVDPVHRIRRRHALCPYSVHILIITDHPCTH